MSDLPDNSVAKQADSRKTSRGGGRRAKQASREKDKPKAPAFIKRNIRPYELLTEEGLVAIEENADIIGEEIGIEFKEDAEVLQIWRDAGADVQGDRVRFPKGMLRKLIQATVPKEFIQHARNPEKSVPIGGHNTVFVPMYGAPFVRDLDKGRRYSTLEDFDNIVKLSYSVPWLHHSGGTVCEPMDIPVHVRHLDMLYSHIRNSDKAFMGSVTAGNRAEDSIEMVKILFGDDFVDENCVLVSVINVNSPLVYDKTMLDSLKAYSRANQACILTPFILTGAMGPTTMAGAMSQVLVEAMAGMALTQLIRPGCPTLMGNFTSSMSLKTGAPTFGMPEPALGIFAMGQLARRLGVPLRGGGSLAASKVADYQAAQESTDTLMPTMLSGMNFILHAAGWLEGGLSFGYEKFMLDCDHLGMMHTFAANMSIDENALALSAYREVGPGKHYLGCAHTMENYQTAFYNPELSDSNSFEQWVEDGSQDSIKRANTAWKKTLREYQQPLLDESIDEALQAFIAQRKESLPKILS